uniref:Uncharacterized protein n=1 Tax=Nonomuraea gerenzanensis TaxID=93944 RepID=A0A1M4BLC5_9ACTN|nr:hypothetical protein [Nonomuraea gerenzanensis]SAP16354.1 hypothetical protein BN4615_P11017 [Nonomuraea gerenzanensis]
MTATRPNPGTAMADAVLTGVPYAYYLRGERVTTTAFTTREPGLLIRSQALEQGGDALCWLIVHWQGEAIQGAHDYPSPWQALIAADQLGALGVDWRQTGQALKAAGPPPGLWDALLETPLIGDASAVLTAVTGDDEDRFDGYDQVMDLLAAGWRPEALTSRLVGPGVAVPLVRRLRPLLQALAPLDGRPPWCGRCLPVARQRVGERGWLAPCPRCHPAPNAGVVPA